MEIINNTLYISYRELVRSEDNPAGVMPEGTYKKLMFVTKILKRLSRGCYSQEVLIEFNSVPIKYRSQWIELHGDPMAVHKSQSFVSRIKPDIEARNFFAGYRFENNPSQGIKAERIEQYCTDVAILNAITSEISDMTKARAKSGARPSGYWDAALQRVNSVRELYPMCNLPQKAITLKRKYDRYIAEGYEAMVHKGNGNQNTATITDEDSKTTLMELLCYGTQFNCEKVAEKYNIWAAANDKREITARTVVNFMQKHDAEISMYREGRRKWENKYGKVMHRERPSAPLLLINSDDNDLDLYCKVNVERRVKGKVKVVKSDWYRFKLYVVLDAHCDYILGYAYGHEITKEVIRAAYRNAMHHVKELTGGYHLWHQIVADRWGLNSDLRQFYERQAIFTPPEKDNARSKVIESSFGIVWHNELREYDNYAGPNITSNRRLSEEWIDAHKANFPTYAEGVVQIEKFIEKMRNVSRKDSGKSRQQVWLENVQAKESSRERRITREAFLSLFGEKHEHKNRLTNRGVNITVDSERYIYDIPDNIYLDVVGKTTQVTYDPEDMSSILVEDDNGIRFVAQEYVKNKMALYDQNADDKKTIQERISAKRAQRQTIISAKDQREELSYRGGIDAEGMLKAGYLTKEDNFAAQAAYRTSLYGSSSISQDDDDDNFLSTFYSPKTNKKQITQ